MALKLLSVGQTFLFGLFKLLVIGSENTGCQKATHKGRGSKKLHMLFKQGLIGMIDFKNSLPELHRIAMVFFVQIECIDNEIEHGLKV
jgi:hypothetical protein